MEIKTTPLIATHEVHKQIVYIFSTRDFDYDSDKLEFSQKLTPLVRTMSRSSAEGLIRSCHDFKEKGEEQFHLILISEKTGASMGFTIGSYSTYVGQRFGIVGGKYCFDAEITKGPLSKIKVMIYEGV